MKEQLVSFETALIAKQRSFNIPVCHYSNLSEPDIVITAGEFNWNYLAHGDTTVSRPTQSLLQKWLRDEMDVHVSIQRHVNPDGVPRYCAVVNYANEVQGTNGILKSNNYENVLEEGLKIGLSLAFYTNYSKIPKN